MVTSTGNVRSIAAIDADIAAAKEALANVKGSETEVYARIVGYYRSVRNWNKGKRNEYNHRKMFEYDGKDSHTMSINGNTIQQNQFVLTSGKDSCITSAPQKEILSSETEQTSKAAVNSDIFSYEFFARNTCPNCPPVKNYMETLELQGKRVDVDTDEGLARAAEMGVFAAPTVIFYGKDNTEIARAHNVQELTVIFEPSVCEAAC